MSYSSEHSELRVRLSDNIGDTPVEWPNTSFIPLDPPTMYVRFAMLNGDAKPLTILSTTKDYRHPGSLVISVFAPVNEGSGDAVAKADEIAGWFRGWTGETVRCYEASVKIIGKVENYFQVNVNVSIIRDESF